MQCGSGDQALWAADYQAMPVRCATACAVQQHSMCSTDNMIRANSLRSLEHSSSCRSNAPSSRDCKGHCSRCNCAICCCDDIAQQQLYPHRRSSAKCTAQPCQQQQLLLPLLLIVLLLLAAPASGSRQLHISSSRVLQQNGNGNFWTQQSSSSNPAPAAAAALQRSNDRYNVQLSDLQIGSPSRSGGGRSNRWGRRLAGSNDSNLEYDKVAAARRVLLAAAQPGGSSTSTTPPQQQVIGGISSSGSVAGHNPNALCSATINYGASVGDASKGTTAEVPIFVASFDVVVTDGGQQQQQQQSNNGSQWVLGWQFTAGEHIQQDRDLFGDDSSYAVHLMPEMPTGGAAQGVAVLGNGSLGVAHNEATFNFVGRKGPKGLEPDAAPFRVAPPSHLFLNNHYCWPLLRPSSAAVTAAAGPPAVGSTAAGSSSSSTIHIDIRGTQAILSDGSDQPIEVPVYGQDKIGDGSSAAGSSEEQQQQQQWSEVAVPKIRSDQMPDQLIVEYLPVEFQDEEPGLFARTLTQLYFKLSNNQAEFSDPVYLDQITLQYWFHGPQEPPTSSSSSNGTAGNGTVAGSSSSSSSRGDDDTDAVAALGASQFRMTCSDATPGIGCAGIDMNVTTGLPNVFGARYVLNIKFPMQQPGSSSSSIGGSSPGATMRYLLLPNSTAAASSTGLLQQQQYDSEGHLIYIKPITEIEAIVVINYRRFFASIDARDDYSFLDTPLAPTANSSGSGADKAQPVRRLREANPKIPAYIGNQLAWGSPPKAVQKVPAGNSTAAAGSSPPPPSSSSSTNYYPQYPPGSYCQKSADGSLICGVDMLYCCFGSGTLSGTAPDDWQERLLAGTIGGTAAGPGSGTAADPGGTADGTRSGVTDPAAPAGGDDAAAAGGGSSGVQGYVIALSVTLPVVALGFAVSLFMLMRWFKSEIKRKTSNASAGEASTVPLTQNGDRSNPGGGLVNELDDSSGTGISHHSWGSNSNNVNNKSRIVRALLGPINAEPVVGLLNDVEMGTAAAAAATTGSSGSSNWGKVAGLLCCRSVADDRLVPLGCGRNDTAMMSGDIPQHHGHAAAAGSSIVQQQPGKAQTAGVQLATFAGQIPTAAAPAAAAAVHWQQPDVDHHHHQQQQQQWHSSVLTPEQLAFVYNTNPQQSLVWSVRHRGRTLPAGVLARALQVCGTWQQQQQQQQQVVQQQVPGTADDVCCVEGSSGSSNDLARSSSSSNDDMHGEGRLKRHATWNGRLSEDAFGEDLIGHLLNLQLDRDLISPQNPGPSSPGLKHVGSSDHDLVDRDLVAVQSGQVLPGGASTTAGAAAAAVEAAIAAINAAISGSSSCHVQQQHGLAGSFSRSPDRGLKPNLGHTLGSLIPSPPSSKDPLNPAPSFYKALMATGGVLKPPGGPPIPLNVDYIREIQPHLGRLVGKGGFGHVYEGLWRSRKVAVKLLTVDTDEPAVLDAFLKEVALCACLRGCDRVVKLLGACLGGVGNSAAGSSQAAADPDPRRSSSSGSSSSNADPSPFGQEQDMPTTVAATTAFDDGRHQQAQNQQQQQQQQMALIMELMEGGNLAQRIYHPSKRRLTYLEILQVALDIVTGLAYLHPAVVHRDLKPQNVLLDKQGRAAIADFGISRFKDPHRSYLSVTHQGGTPNYMAPELFNGTRVDEAADVYSLGCILYECLARKQPFGHLASEAKSFNVLFKIIVAVAINKERPPLPADTPPRLASLIGRCWLEDPGQRPRVSELANELRDMIQEELSCHAEELGRIRRLSTRSRSISLASHSSSNSLAPMQQQQQDVLSNYLAAPAAIGSSSSCGLNRTKSDGAAVVNSFSFRASADNAAAAAAPVTRAATASLLLDRSSSSKTEPAGMSSSAAAAADSGGSAIDSSITSFPVVFAGDSVTAAAAAEAAAAAAAASSEVQSFDGVGLWHSSNATSYKSINSSAQISPHKVAAAAAAAGSTSSSVDGVKGVATPSPKCQLPPAAARLLSVLLPWPGDGARRAVSSDIEAPAAAVPEGSAPSYSSGCSAGSRYGGVVDWIMRKVSSSSNSSAASQPDPCITLPITAADALTAASSSVVITKPSGSTAGPPTPARAQDRRPSLAVSVLSDSGPPGSSSTDAAGPKFPDHQLLIRSKSTGISDHSGASPMLRDQTAEVPRSQSLGADPALLWQQQQRKCLDLGSSAADQDLDGGYVSVLPAVYNRGGSSGSNPALSPVPDCDPSTVLYVSAGSTLLGQVLQQQQQQQSVSPMVAASPPAAAAAAAAAAGAAEYYVDANESEVLFASASSNTELSDQILGSFRPSSSSSSPAMGQSYSSPDEGVITVTKLRAAPPSPFSAAAAAALEDPAPSQQQQQDGDDVATVNTAAAAPAAVQRKVSFAVLPEVMGS